ncbi:hypothetical protein ACW9UR_21715 [Halovulum sp. GXIMD14794]
MSEAGDRAIAEIVRLHEAIVSWITGRMPEDRFAAEIAGPLAPAFTIVEPDGQIQTRDEVLKGLFDFHSGNPDFHIAIEAPRVVAERDGLVVVTYIERQSGAKRSAASNARQSTGIYEVGETVSHLFLQETRLPA